MTAGRTRRAGRPAVAGVLAALALAGVACSSPADAPERTVEIFGNFTDRDATAFAAAIAPFERRSGIDVRFVGSSTFESDLLTRVRRGNPPDLALVPQPGLVAELVRLGAAVPLPAAVAADTTDHVDPRLVELGRVDGTLYAAWYRISVKSLVWYSPREFAARGLTVPATYDELLRLGEGAAAEGVTPWCLGIRDGGATGWVATDWVEDLVLRFGGADTYDRWVRHEIPFTDPAISDAVSRLGAIALAGGQVHGGTGAVVETAIQESAEPLLTDPAGCLLHRQASFLPDLLPGGVEIGPSGELWMFPLPGPAAAEPGTSPPLVVGGQLIVAFTADPDEAAVLEALTGPATSSALAAAGGFLSPRLDLDPDGYARPLERDLAARLRTAEVLRFDASDQMPPAVGVDAFWTGMAAYLGGAQLVPTLEAIDAAWPSAATQAAAAVGVPDARPTEARDD